MYGFQLLRLCDDMKLLGLFLSREHFARVVRARLRLRPRLHEALRTNITGIAEDRRADPHEAGRGWSTADRRTPRPRADLR